MQPTLQTGQGNEKKNMLYCYFVRIILVLANSSIPNKFSPTLLILTQSDI